MKRVRTGNSKLKLPTCVIVLLAVLAAACSGSGGNDGSVAAMPAVVMPAGEIERLRANAAEFAASYYGSWPDVGPALDRMADDVVFWDPADGDYVIEGKSTIVPIIVGFANYFGETEWLVENTFVNADGAAYRVSIAEGYWPPWLTEPADHPPSIELDQFRFARNAITNFDIWFDDGTLEMIEFGCFAIQACPTFRTIVDRYAAAWSLGDANEIAALYAADAVFTDTLFGIDAVGPTAIAGLGEDRFGAARRTFEVVSLYAQTDGPEPATADDPDVGPVIAVGIHYRISNPDGTGVLESLTTFELGTRQLRGFDLHPRGLITREEVFHEVDSILRGV